MIIIINIKDDVRLCKYVQSIIIHRELIPINQNVTNIQNNSCIIRVVLLTYMYYFKLRVKILDKHNFKLQSFKICKKINSKSQSKNKARIDKNSLIKSN